MLGYALAFYLGGFVAAAVLDRTISEPSPGSWRDSLKAGIAWPALVAVLIFVEICEWWSER